MQERAPCKALSRRELFGVLGVGLLGGAGLDLLLHRAEATPEATQQAIKKLLGESPMLTGKVLLHMPQVAENGHTVPITVGVESPMSPADYVKAIHVLAERNPQPEVASFYFSPLSGKAEVSTRLRLAKTQAVIALAVMHDGTVYQARTEVKVTIGGCG